MVTVHRHPGRRGALATGTPEPDTHAPAALAPAPAAAILTDAGAPADLAPAHAAVMLADGAALAPWRDFSDFESPEQTADVAPDVSAVSQQTQEPLEEALNMFVFLSAPKSRPQSLALQFFRDRSG